MNKPTTMSLFCGAGGETLGKMLAFEEMGIRTGDTVAYALNHWDEACMTHRKNFPGIECRQESIEEVTAADFGLAGQTINMLWASPSCVHFSTARGGKPVNDQQRSHAHEVIERFIKVADVKVLLLENVPEFKTWGPLHQDHSNGCTGRVNGESSCRVKSCHFEKPIKERKGEFFKAFIAELQSLGYEVEHRILCAADLGDPTIRKRFYLQAAKDGVPIRWPNPTHRDPKKAPSLFEADLPPWRTAAECIDFTMQCPSIFDRKRPLAENTLKRIAAGIERFVLAGEPFLVNLTHGGRVEDLQEPMKTITGAKRGEKALVSSQFTLRTDMPQSNAQCTYSLREPLRTVTTSGGHAMVEASFVAKHFTGVVGNKPDAPLGAITSKDHHSLVSAHLVHLRGTNANQVARTAAGMDQPMATLTSSGTHEAMVAAHLVKFRNTSAGQHLSSPMPTLTAGGIPRRPSTGNAMGLACATLIQTGYGERVGQAPRVLEIQSPLGTVMATGQKHALVHTLLTNTTGHAPRSPREPLASITTGQQQVLLAASLVGIDQASSLAIWPADEPLSTITTKARHSMAAAYLARPQQAVEGQGLGTPMSTAEAGPQRFDLVAAFLERYGKGMSYRDHRGQLAPVTVVIQGQEYVLADICLRMLQPRELARAMGVPDSFKFPAGMSKEKKVRMIGNMCAVSTVRALVRTIVEDRRSAFGIVAA